MDLLTWELKLRALFRVRLLPHVIKIHVCHEELKDIPEENEVRKVLS